MPYIPQHSRIALKEGRSPASAGELNYLITQAINYYLTSRDESYAAYNTAIGILKLVSMPDTDRVYWVGSGLTGDESLLFDLLMTEINKYSDATEATEGYGDSMRIIDILGVLEAAQHELYRRKVAAYENEKLAQNGDVF